jgi:hypothetical protein
MAGQAWLREDDRVAQFLIDLVAVLALMKNRDKRWADTPAAIPRVDTRARRLQCLGIISDANLQAIDFPAA